MMRALPQSILVGVAHRASAASNERRGGRPIGLVGRRIDRIVTARNEQG
jgi:hypothetical protein